MCSHLKRACPLQKRLFECRRRGIVRGLNTPALARPRIMSETTDYKSWPADRLVERVTELEARLQKLTADAKSVARPTSSLSASEKRRTKKAKKDGSKAFDPSRYSTRYIALKFAYLGQNYNGLEHHANNTTPLPTVEEILWRALMKTKLIFPTGEAAQDGQVDWTGCEYSKCGRTDRGVSAFGQVVALRVRSARPLPGTQRSEMGGAQKGLREMETKGHHVAPEGIGQQPQQPQQPQRDFDPINDELPYIQILNRVLPNDIRILAWCDPPPEFSARFSCEERQYKYFFTNPAYAPVPGARGLSRMASGKQLREGWLDIEAMRDAAGRLEGLHDFRNFCKIDPAKQITNFQRRIFHASIEEIDPRMSPVGYVGGQEFGPTGNVSTLANGDTVGAGISTPKLYTFNVHGSAFLWHQVRNMVAVLFLVGQGLEQPSIVSDLLNVEKMPTRPKYEMADDAPLVLWDCIFPSRGDPDRKDALEWIRVGDDGGRETNKMADVDGGDGKFGRNGIMDVLWSTWRQRKIDEVLAGSLIDLVAGQGRQTSIAERAGAESRRSMRVFDGGNDARSVGNYVPIDRKERTEHFEVVNARYREKKGVLAASNDQVMEDVDE